MKQIAIISDLHINPSKPTYPERHEILKRVFCNISSEAIAICGDITGHGTMEQWNIFRDLVSTHCLSKQLFICPGNMDVVESESGRTAYIEVRNDCCSSSKHTYFAEEYDSFIVFSMGINLSGDGDPISKEQMSLLETYMKKAAQSQKISFVFCHVPLSGTFHDVWDGACLGPQSKDIKKILNQYGGTVLYCSGHVHRGLSATPLPSVVTQGNVTYLNTPSLLIPNTEHHGDCCIDQGTGFLVTVSEESILIQGYQFLHNHAMNEFRWCINK